MHILESFWSMVAGHHPFSTFFYMFLSASGLNAFLAIAFKTRKIQPNGFKWTIYRDEFAFGLLNVMLSGVLIGGMTAFLSSRGLSKIISEPTGGWGVTAELALYFFAFDTWFYWLHRLMHKGQFYTWIHKIHHRSTSPNVATTFSVSPLESLVNGGFIPLFTAVVPVHAQSLAPMTAIAGAMGIYVHCGYEFMPRWWNKSWVTKWFITATFHDQHHKYFNWNFGGYTTIWDRLCGTIRRKFENDFDQAKVRGMGNASALSPQDPIPSNLK